MAVSNTTPGKQGGLDRRGGVTKVATHLAWRMRAGDVFLVERALRVKPEPVARMESWRVFL